MFEHGWYIFCVACMLCAHDVGVNFAIALHLKSKTQKRKARQTCAGVEVVTRFDLSNMACICFV